jgi:hypothetical protein
MRINETAIVFKPKILLSILMALVVISCDWMNTDFTKCSDRVKEELESCNIQGNDDCTSRALRGQKYCGEEYGE